MPLCLWHCIVRRLFRILKHYLITRYKSSSDSSTTNVIIETAPLGASCLIQQACNKDLFSFCVLMHELQMRIGSASVNAIKSMEFNTTYKLGPSSRLLCK